MGAGGPFAIGGPFALGAPPDASGPFALGGPTALGGPFALGGPSAISAGGGVVVLVVALDAAHASDGRSPRAIGGGGSVGGMATVDTFTGVAGTDLLAHVPDGGGSWVKPVQFGGEAKITAAGRARLYQPDNSPDAKLLWSVAPPSADYSVSADVCVMQLSGVAGVVARCAVDSLDDWLAAWYDAGAAAVRLVQMLGGTTQDVIGSFSASWAVGETHRIALTVSGGTASVTVDGAAAIGATSVEVSGAGRAGITLIDVDGLGAGDSTLLHLDDFATDFAPSAAATTTGVGPEFIIPIGLDSLAASFGLGGLTAALAAADWSGFAGLGLGSVLVVTVPIVDVDGFSASGRVGLLSASASAFESAPAFVAASIASSLSASDAAGAAAGGVPLALLQAQLRTDFDLIAVAESASVSAFPRGLDSASERPAGSAAASISGVDFSSHVGAAFGSVAPHAVFAADAAGGTGSATDLGSCVAGSDSAAWRAVLAPSATAWASDSAVAGGFAFVSLAVTALDAFGLADSAALRAFTSTLVYNVYANAGDGGPIDYTSAVAVVDGLEWTFPPLPAGSDWWFAVRAYSVATSLEESNIDAAVRVTIDSARRDASGRPDPPTAIRASSLAGGMVRVEWSDRRPAGTSRATGYRLYQGVGSVDWTTPVLDVDASTGVGGSFLAVVGPFAHGSVHAFGVRAYNASAEETNVVQALATADALGPAAVGGFAIGLSSEA